MAIGKKLVIVVASDVLLAAALYGVLLDLQWRAAYASSDHLACSSPCSYSPSYGVNFLTRFFTMTGNGVTLVSPPMLDWVQVLAVLLAVINIWFAYDAIRDRRRASVPAAPS